MTRILLIRHGESEANKQGVFAGHYNPPLTELGQRQAKLTAEFVKENYPVTAIYSSDLQRAYSTALALSDMLNLPVTTSTQLREIYGGEWEKVKFSQLPALYPEDFRKWTEQLDKAVCTNGESVEAMAQRVLQALTEIAKENDGKTVAVACHGTPIRAAQCLVEHGTLAQLANTPWATNASVTELTYDNDSWALIAASQDTHLASLRTEMPAGI